MDVQRRPETILAYLCLLWEMYLFRLAVFIAVCYGTNKFGRLAYKYARKWLASREPVNEVLFLNHTSNVCIRKHNTLYEKQKMRISKRGHFVMLAEKNLLHEAMDSLTRTPRLFDCDNPYCSRNIIRRYIYYIDQAQYCIDAAMYTLTAYPFTEAFRRAISRKIHIRIISDKEMVYSTGSQVRKLHSFGIPARVPDVSNAYMMHHKYLVFDGPERVAQLKAAGCNKPPPFLRGLLLTGSLNLTCQAVSGNWENVLITSDRTAVADYEREFERLWSTLDEERCTPHF